MKTQNQLSPVRLYTLDLMVWIATMAMLLLFPFYSIAQINYFDIQPDTTILKGGSYNIDLNNDSSADFKVSLSNDPMFQDDIMVCLQDSCFISYFMVDGCYIIVPLELNDTVAKTNFEYTIKPLSYRLYFLGLDYCIHSGWFAGQSDKYVGLKLIKNGNAYYGWLRIDVAADGYWVKLKDYAYAGPEILAGQTVSTIPNKKVESQFSICTTESEIVIIPNSNLKITSASLQNSISQITKLQVVNNQVKILKSHHKRGLYFVCVTTSAGDVFIKLLLPD